MKHAIILMAVLALSLVVPASGYSINGEGNYPAGTVVPINAPPPVPPTIFAQWVGDTETVSDVWGPSTTLIMPARDITVTATYDWPINLTVDNGSGSGNYAEGRVVWIEADAHPTGQVFKKWLGDVATLDNIYDARTIVTMPGYDVIVEATYKYAGDLNDSDAVDIADLNMVLIDWGKCGVAISDPRADGNGDGCVDIIDLNLVLIDWGKTATP